MNLFNKKPLYLDYLLIIAGTGLIAFGIQWLYDPSGFVTGGFTGIGIIVKQVTKGVTEGGIPIWLTNLALNIPVFLLALKLKGRRLLRGQQLQRHCFLHGCMSPTVDMAQGDPLLAAVFGGVLFGVGMGLVL